MRNEASVFVFSQMLTKADFLLRDDIHFLNHGSFGACPRHLLDVQRSWQERLERQPVLFHRELADLMQEARRAVSQYLGARPQDLVYVTNATYGVSVAASMLRSMLAPGAEVLMTNHEYGACVRAWEHYLQGTGAKIVQAAIPIPAPSIEEIEELIWSAVTPSTRVLFLSHVTSPTAIRLPIEQLCARARKHGILTVIDGSHVPAHLSLNLQTLDADVYTGNFHKWMCTPKGSAFLWVHPSLHRAVQPLIVSWGNLIPTVGDGSFVDDLEYLGTRDVSPFLTVPEALRWMNQHNWDLVQTEARNLRDYGMHMLLGMGLTACSNWTADELQMGAVLLPRTTDVQWLKNELYNTHRIEVVVHRVLDQAVLRFSTHAHTSKVDLDALSTALDRLL